MWHWIKVPKGIALVSFILPWMTVSCSNQKIVEATGFGLAFGKFNVMGPAANGNHNGGLNLWLIFAILVIGAGINLLFATKKRQPRAVLVCALVALASIYIGTQKYTKENMIEAAAKSGNSNGMDQAAMSMIQVDWQLGYWVAVLSLVAAAGMSLVASNEVDAETQKALSKIPKEANPLAVMRTCPKCGTRFGGGVMTCPTDGDALV